MEGADRCSKGDMGERETRDVWEKDKRDALRETKGDIGPFSWRLHAHTSFLVKKYK